MSGHKLRKYLNKPPTPVTGTQKLTPVLLSDSKGIYLKHQTQTGIDQHIKFWCEKSRTTTRGYWWLRENLDHKIGHLDNISLYVWLGTCDLTSYNKGYISIRTPDSDESVDKAVENYNKIVDLLQPYPHCKLTFIETPPYSIYDWNKYYQHKDPQQFINQDSILIRQINKLNENIRQINSNLGVHPPKLEIDLSHNQQKTSKNRHRRLRDQLTLPSIKTAYILTLTWHKFGYVRSESRC